MKTKLVELIEKSPSLSPEKVAFYLEMIGSLSSEQKDDLEKIFTAEAEAVRGVEFDKTHQKSDLNKKFISEIDAYFKTEYTSAVQSEEKDEKEAAEILIKNI